MATSGAGDAQRYMQVSEGNSVIINPLPSLGH
jgi:hypothetical protein